MNLELSDETKAKIRSTMQSEGWKSLVEDVWGPMWDEHSRICMSCRDNHRFNQGIMQGFQTMMAWADGAVKSDQPQQPKVFASELALMSRRNVSFRK